MHETWFNCLCGRGEFCPYCKAEHREYMEWDKAKRAEQQRLMAEQRRLSLEDIKSRSRPIGTFYALNCRDCDKQSTCKAFPVVMKLLQGGSTTKCYHPCAIRHREDNNV